MTVVETGVELEDLYKLLDCRLIDVTARQANGDSLTIDDEGCFRPSPASFFFNGEGPICGPALVAGVDENGDMVAPAYSVNDVETRVTWAKFGMLPQTVAWLRSWL